LGSDGLFDNLYDDEILEEVQNCIDQQTEEKDQEESQKILKVAPQSISDALAHRAKIVSEDPDNPSSPFQVRAMHEGLYYQVFVISYMWIYAFFY
jgi:serine/threonine protein phosphatase PrpC